MWIQLMGNVEHMEIGDIINFKDTIGITQRCKVIEVDLENNKIDVTLMGVNQCLIPFKQPTTQSINSKG